MVRPGVSVTATYAKNGRIIELLVGSRITEMIESRGTVLSQDSVDAILIELVPDSARGKYIIGGFINAICEPESDCSGSWLQFQNVTIYYNSAREGGLRYAVVKWKD